MASGWAGDDAVSEQIDATLESSLVVVRSLLPKGESKTHCSNCHERIPEARRKALIGVKYCVPCQEEIDAEVKLQSTYNRKGSKDSQLR